MTLRCIIASIASALLLTAAGYWVTHEADHYRLTAVRKDQGREVPAASLPPAFVRSLRPNYPYSVIPGGAYSPAELRNATIRDATVRQHYAGFHLEKARLVAAPRAMHVFVSYRWNNQVYWSRKPLRISKGETLLSDGEHFARARCGNRLSETFPGTLDQIQRDPPEVLEEYLSMPDADESAIRSGRIELAETPADAPVAGAFPPLPAAPPYVSLIPSEAVRTAGVPMTTGFVVGGYGAGFGSLVVSNPPRREPPVVAPTIVPEPSFRLVWLVGVALVAVRMRRLRHI